ncbi:bifunctional phosphopantothenoylcysteine decarboxylase/phosphopantothenate synthase [Altererythrobacter sp. CC-YST694]|uniref:bifunctional phosphopantothenoylcysteine decarboxylase/phosphopantothenate synthase n=1 Tax=Altererythrobacter sp. CC-YST694 TaxID=2755038 RepID=UPI001D016AD0|nr:bifunctional phosphopantothenoylcysteine decarboxylase/phosphopantothenate synthase [Altererythrobacter sp. CC-YST694]MCB5425769.1 bifunctional phosphopantothenoylcysteine decarboxylase/phosphopantothenate synthase [Altererythrobacter sp. CC-YST694]
MTGPRILLVVGGGIAAYKSCELVRLIRKGGGDVTCVLTEGGAQFVTPMSLAALSENKVHTSLWNLTDEAEMGHIQLSRNADLVVVCPATADLLAKMAAGIADDLATTLILATDKPVLAVPAMNVRMWQHEATQRNVAWLRHAGVRVMQPDEGPMACGEFGPGRLPEPEMVWLEIAEMLGLDPGLLGEGGAGRHQIADYLEALEPEDEEEDLLEEASTASKGGLSGLFASLIQRTTPRRIREEEVEYGDLPALPEDFVPSSSPFQDALSRAYPEPGARAVEVPVEAEPDLSSPLFARKGKARSAPATDREALNHLVRTGSGGAAAESVDWDQAIPPLAEIREDPLEGQPGFEIAPEHRPLYGRHVLVTAGPTHEPIDPVRYIANRSSGKQGFAIAAAAAALGARVTLVTGPVHLRTPPGVDRIDVESALEMADAVKRALPADAAVMVAAVADWRTMEFADAKIKKRANAPPALLLTENPDILATIAAGPNRPRLLVGFAAETNDLIENAKKKRKSKGADWIVANDVKGDTMGGEQNTVHIVTADSVEDWPVMPKEEVALKLMERIADALE